MKTLKATRAAALVCVLGLGMLQGCSATGGGGSARSAAPAPRGVRMGDDAFLSQYAATYRFSHGRPKSLAMTHDGSAVLFLRSAPRSFVQDLYEFDCTTGKERVLLTAEGVLGGGKENLTAEELARRERMRMASRGIASFKLSEDSKKILVPLSGRLFVVERATGAVMELKSQAGYPLDPMFSPDGSLVACVRDDEVYVADAGGGKEWKVTSGATTPTGGTISHGTAEFVAQEEMSRFSGYWFSPDSRMMCYQETDTAGMEIFHIADPVNPQKEAQSWPYPRAGAKNADVKLGITAIEGGKTTWIQWDRSQYPYVATVSWKKNAPLTILVQNRTQTEEVLLSVDEKTGATTRLLVERDPAWLNIHESCPKWLEDGSGFLWVSERYDGQGGAGKDYARLELRNRDGSLRAVLTPPGFAMLDLVSLDSAAGEAYVSCAADPTQVHVARVSVKEGAGEPQMLTSGEGQFGAAFARDHPAYLETASTLAGEMRWSVKKRDGSEVGEIVSKAEMPERLPKVELTMVKDPASGEEFHASILRPRGFSAKVKYPVIVKVYGGPGANTVNASGQAYVLDQWMADQGYVVVSIDGRGTPRRGRAWERAIKDNVIDVPLADQVGALKALGKRYAEMDLSRVGMTGWSFGGYFSSMGAMRRGDVYRCAVAGAPVCAWEDYDTHYTERYMGLPRDNAKGYEAANVLTYCKDLKVPLLIIHGTADDNVYFMHSLKMTGELFRSGRHFEFLPLAGFTHSVPDPVVMMNLQKQTMEFFETNLSPRGR